MCCKVLAAERQVPTVRGWAKTGGITVCCMGRLGTVAGLFAEEKCGLGVVNIPYLDNIQDFICSRFVSHISSIKSVIFNLHWKAWSSFTKAKGYLWVFNQNFFQDVFLYYRTLEESSVHWQPTQLWPPRAGNHWRSIFRWPSQCFATILGCVDRLFTHHLSLNKDTLLTKNMDNLFGFDIKGYSLKNLSHQFVSQRFQFGCFRK